VTREPDSMRADSMCPCPPFSSLTRVHHLARRPVSSPICFLGRFLVTTFCPSTVSAIFHQSRATRPQRRPSHARLPILLVRFAQPPASPRINVHGKVEVLL